MDEHVLDDLAAYLDDELAAPPRARVAAHLESCAECRAALVSVERGRHLVASLDASSLPEPRAQRLREALLEGAAPTSGRAWWRPSRAAWAATVLLATGAGVGLYWQVNRPWIRLEWTDTTATPFEEAGRRWHDDLLAGRTHMDVTSDDARALWSWLDRERAPVTTPVRAGADPARFVPVGAAVRTLAGARASVLVYRVDGRPVTLALAHRDAVTDRPAAGWWSKRVAHRWDRAGRHSLTWTIGSGTYVLVADLDGDGLTACLICHDDARFVERVSRPEAARR